MQTPTPRWQSIEKTLDHWIDRTNPGPPPRGVIPAIFVFGVVVGLLSGYLIWHRATPVQYEFHTTPQGIVWRLNKESGAAEFAYPGASKQWQTIK